MADYAIVVGVARYPGLAVRGVSADLDGPDNDARAMYDWLVDPGGGRLDPANVTLIRSADTVGDTTDPQPAAARIERELARLEERTRDTPGGRLYLYFSGHGFAPVLEEGALFTAEATHVRHSYIYAHAWLRWFRRAGRFREFVLLMDCCMSYRVAIPVNEITMGAEIATGVPGPAFVGLAAQTGQALEYPMPDGTVHGVFTWALLAGLRGGAADERGRVTGASLRMFLRTAMPEFLPAQVRRAAAVDLYPFVRADDGIVFQRLAAPPTHRVTLRVPAAAVGHPLAIWTGRPHAPVAGAPLTADGWTGELQRGLYVAEVPAAGLRHGFQVSGAGAVTVEVAAGGPAVVPPEPAGTLGLEVVADNPAAAITVTDHRFELAFADTGRLEERDLPGVYKVRVEVGRDLGSGAEEIILLDRDLSGYRLAAPAVPSPAPIPGGTGAPGERERPFAAAATRHGRFAAPAVGSGVISVSARSFDGLELFDAAGRLIAVLAGAAASDDAIWDREVPPGGYHLRQTLPDGAAVEMAVVASADWVTQVALRRPPTGFIDDAAVFMRPAAGGPRAADQDAVVEVARLALAHGRDLFAGGRGALVRRLLLAEYLDPVAGIVGAHLVLRAGGDTGPLLDRAVRRLRQFVGWDHPDVEALSLRCADPALRRVEPFVAPPMFRAGWDLMVAASHAAPTGRPELVPAALWGRVHATVGIGPFFAWAADEATRAVHAGQLAGWAAAVVAGGDGGAQARPDAVVADAALAARRLGIPAAAFAGPGVRPGG